MVHSLLQRLPLDPGQMMLITNAVAGRPITHHFGPLPQGVEVYADTFPNPLLSRGRRALFADAITYVRAARRLFLFLRRRSPVMVHLHFVSLDVFLLALLRYFFRYRLVVTFHGSDLHVAQRSALARVKVWTALRSADAVTTVSQEMATWLRQQFSAPSVTCIANGVDCADVRTAAAAVRSPIPSDHFVYVGRLHPHKRVPLLVQTFKDCIDGGCNRNLFIIGDGEDRPLVEQFIARHRLGDRIVLVGALDRRRALSAIAQARCLLLFSDQEGCPMVLLESMALGVPAIATTVGGIPELIVDGETGLLFSAHSHGRAIDHVLRMARDPVAARVIGRRAAEVARHQFDLGRTVQGYMGLYQHLTSSVRSTPATVL